MHIKKQLVRQCNELQSMLEFSILSDTEFDNLDTLIVGLRLKISAIIQVEVHEDTKKFKEAVKALKKANKAIEKAHDEIRDVAKTIAKIAKIIDVAAQAASAAAGP